MSDNEYESCYSELKKSNYFKNCTSCRQVKNRQQILLGKCDALHDLTHIITDYSGCDKCCKLRIFFDDYICSFTKLCKYPEYTEVQKILRNCGHKDEYTLELHFDMKTMYENLDKFDFLKWHQEKKNSLKDTSYCIHYQMVYNIFLRIIYHLKSDDNDDLPFERDAYTKVYKNRFSITI